MQSPHEKRLLERAAVEQFVEIFNARAGRGVLEFVSLLDPPEPDVRCRLNGADVFIEIAHVYGTASDARFLLGRGGCAQPTREERLESDLVPLDVRVISSLNIVLARKASKTYASSPVWLVIRNAFPLWRQSDFEQHRGDIQVPRATSFSELWLTCGPRANFGLMRLDSTNVTQRRCAYHHN